MRIVDVGLADKDDARGVFETDVIPRRCLHGPGTAWDFLQGDGCEVNVSGSWIGGPPDFFVRGEGGGGDFGGGAVIVFGVRRLPAVVEGGGKPEQGQEHGDSAPQDGFLHEGVLQEISEKDDQCGQRGNEMPRQRAMIEEEHSDKNHQSRKAQGKQPSGDCRLVLSMASRFQDREHSQGSERGGERQKRGNAAKDRGDGRGAHLQFAGPEAGESEKFVSDEGKAEQRNAPAMVPAARIVPGQQVVGSETQKESERNQADEPEVRCGRRSRRFFACEHAGDGEGKSAGPYDTDETGGKKNNRRGNDGCDLGEREWFMIDRPGCSRPCR